MKDLFTSSSDYDDWCAQLYLFCEELQKNVGSPRIAETIWRTYGIERILDYVQRRGEWIEDQGGRFRNESFKPFWRAVKLGVSEAGEHYFRDMQNLFDQASGNMPAPDPSRKQLEAWMRRHPDGLDEEIVAIRKKNKARIIRNIMGTIERKEVVSNRFVFPEGISDDEKLRLMEEWWNDRIFHLKFAVRDPDRLNEMLDNSLSDSTMRVLQKAREEGIPFFINTYYLSLLNTSETSGYIASDLAIREYIIYNRDIIEEYGNIEAWEKEDKVVPGEPNAAGWILPYHNNLHRRYPEVAIMIPDTLGRTCGGLCVSCQRMYEFQSGGLNFNLDRKIKYESWGKKLQVIMDYFKEDKQLRDILITGGDALMSRDVALKQMFDAILAMAAGKRSANLHRADGEKHAEIRRVRLGTRLPVYLPQRVTYELVELLADFRKEAMKVGIRQFVIQTHFESAMEVTPEATRAVQMLTGAGWLVTNQHVFTVASSRRGHIAKLRGTLAKIGVMPYYTFSVKGFRENRHNFATHARLMQEKHEEKAFGIPGGALSKAIMEKASQGRLTAVEIAIILKQQKIPFIASDRSMMNLPGIGKSMTFRTIGITPEGRRILEFDYDHSRKHSPVVKEHDKVVIVESKPVGAYLYQVENMGEDPEDYETLFGYSQGESEPLFPLFAYPPYRFRITEEFNHFGNG
ncbi:MAG: KamA family protein [Bacteroidales bacterium]